MKSDKRDKALNEDRTVPLRKLGLIPPEIIPKRKPQPKLNVLPNVSTSRKHRISRVKNNSTTLPVESLEDSLKCTLKMCNDDKEKLKKCYEVFINRLIKLEIANDEDEHWQDFIADYLQTRAKYSAKDWTPTTLIISILQKENLRLRTVKPRVMTMWIGYVLKEMGFRPSRQLYKGKRIRGYHLLLE